MMASGTRTRNRGRTRAPNAAHLRARPGQGTSSRLQRLLLVELALAALLVGWTVGKVAMVPAALLAVALVLIAFTRDRKSVV